MVRSLRCFGQVVICAVAFFATVVTSNAADMKITHVVPAGAPRDLGANLMAERIGKDDRCDLQPRVFPGGQLGGTEALIESLQIGALEIAILPASFLVGFQPLVGIMDFPFFWPSKYEDLKKVHASEAMQKLLATTEEKGVKTLAVWHTGYKTWTAAKPLLNSDDYKGLRVRVMPSQVLVRQDELLGMTPIGMPFSETYTALQTGAIDGQENPIDTNFFMKFHEVQDVLTLTNHGTLDQLVMASKSWWDGLSAQCQEAVTEAVAAGGDLTVEKTYEVIDRAMKAFDQEGMKIVEMDEGKWNTLRDQILPGVKEFYVQQNGEKGHEILEAFEQELGDL